MLHLLVKLFFGSTINTVASHIYKQNLKLDKIPNEQNSKWTKPRIGQNPKRKKSQMDKILNGRNPEQTKSRSGENPK